jgi:signal transduction histidine kinase
MKNSCDASSEDHLLLRDDVIPGPWCGPGMPAPWASRGSTDKATDPREHQELETRLVTLSTDDRRRLGQELHDHIGQELTGLGFLAESLYRRLVARESAEAGVAEELVNGIQQSLDRVRALSRDLIPVEVGPQELISALAELATEVERRFGIICRFQCPDPIEVKDDRSATHLLHIAREAVINAVKHAKARHLAISLDVDRGRAMLRVCDDGQGFAGDARWSGGMGLSLMRHRAEVIGARLEIRPAEGGGTLVICSMTLEDVPGQDTMQGEQGHGG